MKQKKCWLPLFIFLIFIVSTNIKPAHGLTKFSWEGKWFKTTLTAKGYCEDPELIKLNKKQVCYLYFNYETSPNVFHAYLVLYDEDVVQWIAYPFDLNLILGDYNKAITTAQFTLVDDPDGTDDDLHFVAEISGKEGKGKFQATLKTLAGMGENIYCGYSINMKAKRVYATKVPAEVIQAVESKKTWSTPSAIFTENHEIDNTSLVIDQNGIWHAVYDGEGVIYINSSTETPVTIAPSPGDDAYYAPSIAIDANGGLHVASIYINASYDHSIAYMNNLDGSWSSPTVIFTENDEIENTSLVIDQSGIWHAVYDYTPAGLKYLNSSSGTPEMIAANPVDELLFAPSIALDKNGGLHIVYFHFPSTNQNSIMYMRK